MNVGKKTLILVVVIALTISGFYFVESNYYLFPSQNASISPQLAGSTVYIENGVSGVVTLKDPFLNKTVDINVAYDPMDSGSGVIVTKDGYIITAFHVVSDPNALDQQNILRKMDSNDVNQYLKEAAVKEYLSQGNPQLGTKLLGNNSGSTYSSETDNQVSNITDSMSQKNLLTVKSSKQVIKVKFPALSNVGNSLNASLVDVGNSGTDEDVAILKVDSVNKDLPALSVSSQKPRIGENIFIYGYPGNTNENYQKAQSIVPKTTSGSLTAETSSSGTVYYKTNAPTAEGYSGGPVVDTQSSVLGILIYGSTSSKQFKQQSGTESGIFLSSNYIIQICKENNVPIQIV